MNYLSSEENLPEHVHSIVRVPASQRQKKISMLPECVHVRVKLSTALLSE